MLNMSLETTLMSLASSIKTANYIIFTFVTVMKSGPNITPWTPVILNRLLEKNEDTLNFCSLHKWKKKKFKKKARTESHIYITHLCIVNIHVITRETSFNVQNVCTV